MMELTNTIVVYMCLFFGAFGAIFICLTFLASVLMQLLPQNSEKELGPILRGVATAELNSSLLVLLGMGLILLSSVVYFANGILYDLASNAIRTGAAL